MRILILGLLFPEELEYFPGEWEVKALPHPSAVPKHVFREAIQSFKPEVTLFQFFADRATVVRGWDIGNIPAKKIAWFIDSHVSGCRQQEISVQHLFDEVCITHSLHIKHFKKAKKLRWLPCGLKAASYQPRFSYPNLRTRVVEPRFDVVFLFEPYGAHEGYTSRKKITDALKPILKQRGLTSLFGANKKQYIELMLSARVCLNISLANDCNIRNFEALALGKKLITDKTPDHGKITGLSELCRFFDRKARAEVIVDAIQETMALTVDDRQQRIDFAKQHSNVVRCIQMVRGNFPEVPATDGAGRFI